MPRRGVAGAQRRSPADPLYTQMRNSALSCSARDFSVTVRPGETQVYGVVMDVDINGRTATVISYVSGDASLHLSGGGGSIGGIGRRRRPPSPALSQPPRRPPIRAARRG
jgi:hypothetical protein